MQIEEEEEKDKTGKKDRRTHKNNNVYKPRYKIAFQAKSKVWAYKNSRLRHFYSMRGRRMFRGGFFRKNGLVATTIKWTVARRFIKPATLRMRKRRGKSHYRYNFYLKQQVRHFYGKITEVAFRSIYKTHLVNTFDRNRSFFGTLEQRADMFLFRMRLLPTIYACNQFIHHKGLLINRKRIEKCPSALIKVGYIISLPKMYWRVMWKYLVYRVCYRGWGKKLVKRRIFKLLKKKSRSSRFLAPSPKMIAARSRYRRYKKKSNPLRFWRWRYRLQVIKILRNFYAVYKIINKCSKLYLFRNFININRENSSVVQREAERVNKAADIEVAKEIERAYKAAGKGLDWKMDRYAARETDIEDNEYADETIVGNKFNSEVISDDQFVDMKRKFNPEIISDDQIKDIFDDKCVNTQEEINVMTEKVLGELIIFQREFLWKIKKFIINLKLYFKLLTKSNFYLFTKKNKVSTQNPRVFILLLVQNYTLCLTYRKNFGYIIQRVLLIKILNRVMYLKNLVKYKVWLEKEKGPIGYEKFFEYWKDKFNFDRDKLIQVHLKYYGSFKYEDRDKAEVKERIINESIAKIPLEKLMQISVAPYFKIKYNFLNLVKKFYVYQTENIHLYHKLNFRSLMVKYSSKSVIAPYGKNRVKKNPLTFFLIGRNFKKKRKQYLTRLKKVHWYIPKYIYFDVRTLRAKLLFVPRAKDIVLPFKCSLMKIFSFYKSLGV